MSDFADLLDEVDRIEALAEPTAADLARLDTIADDPDGLVASMAKMARTAIARRVRGVGASPSLKSEGWPGQGEPAAAEVRSDPGSGAPYTGAEVEWDMAPGTPVHLAADGHREEAPPTADPAEMPLPNTPEQPITLSTMHVVDNVMGVDEAMASGKFVSYLRVSTAKQGASGLGLEAQRRAVADFLAGGRGPVLREFVEVESGKRADRPKLAEALALCRIHGATLVIAKLDRLSRDAHFLLGLEKAGVDFIAADMPTANRLTVGIMAMVADEERRMISKRTKDALAAKARWYANLTEAQRDDLRARGKPVQLGGDKGRLAEVRARGTAAGVAVRRARASARTADLAPIIIGLQAEGATSLAQIAAALTERGIPTSRGAERWSPTQVSRVLKAVAHGP